MLRSIQKGEDVGHAFEYEGEDGHEYGDLEGRKGKGGPKDEVDRAFGVLMPAVSTDLWLRRLEKVDFDIFNEGLRKREWRLPWKAWLAWKRGMF